MSYSSIQKLEMLKQVLDDDTYSEFKTNSDRLAYWDVNSENMILGYMSFKVENRSGK